MKRLFARYGIRMTRQRVSIVESVRKRGPVTAYDVHKAVSSKGSIDLATVYRGLKELTAKQMFREIIDGAGISYFEMAPANPLHPHFYCTRCRGLTCLEAGEAVNVFGEAEAAQGYRIVSVNILLQGVCPRCEREGA